MEKVAEVEAKNPTREELQQMEEQIDNNMERVRAAIASNEDKLLTSALTPDNMNALRVRQVDLSNVYNWLVQVKHNRVIKPLEEMKPRIVRPGI